MKPFLFKAGSSLWYCKKTLDVFEQLSPYSIKLYIGITASMSLHIYVCIIYCAYEISKWSTIFRYFFLFLLFGSIPAAVMFETFTVPLTSCRHQYKSHKFDYLTISAIHSPWIIIYFNPIFSPKLSWLIWCII